MSDFMINDQEQESIIKTARYNDRIIPQDVVEPITAETEDSSSQEVEE